MSGSIQFPCETRGGMVGEVAYEEIDVVGYMTAGGQQLTQRQELWFQCTICGASVEIVALPDMATDIVLNGGHLQLVEPAL